MMARSLHFVSDLHYGLNERGDAATEALAKYVANHARANDVLCLLGDIGSNQTTFRRCLELFEGFRGAKCGIAGNHDIWVRDGEDSYDRLRETSETFATCGFHPLEDNPLELGRLGIVGTIGWYDGSFREDIGIPDGDYERKICRRLNISWADGQHVRWSHSDGTFTDLTSRKLEEHLNRLPATSTVVCCTHHLPTRHLLFHPRWLVPKRWRFANTFLGSERYGEILREDPRVRLSMSGHIHARRQWQDRSLLFATVGGSYQTKELVVWDGHHLARKGFG